LFGHGFARLPVGAFNRVLNRFFGFLGRKTCLSSSQKSSVYLARQIFSILVPPGSPMGSPQVMA
jgi:hypothetical protein